MRSRTRVRRLKSDSRNRFPDPVKFDLPSQVISASQIDRPSWRPSPDDFFAVRDFYKWGDRLWRMFGAASEAGGDALIGLAADAYGNMVQGYKAVEEALRLYKMGVESYDYYLAKAQQFKNRFPDAPTPPGVDVVAPTTSGSVVTKDPVPSVPSVPLPSVPSRPYAPRKKDFDWYGPGSDVSSGGARQSGSKRKHQFKISYADN